MYNHNTLIQITINPWLVVILESFINQIFFIKPFGRPGGGAPRRTDSGKLQTSIIGDPATRFQRPFKKDVDHVLV